MDSNQQQQERQQQNWQAAYICLALRVLSIVSASFSSTALVRIIEADVCRIYYQTNQPSVIVAGHGVAETDCKLAQVQADLSMLNGVNTSLSVIPALLAALPYMILSKALDKKILLLVNITGRIVGDFYFCAVLYFNNTFDIRLIWASVLFNFIGGGNMVFHALTQAITAESIPASSLSRFFLLSSSILLLCSILASASGLHLMQFDTWLPIKIGMAWNILAIPLLSILISIQASDHSPSPSSSLTTLLQKETRNLRTRGRETLRILRTTLLPMIIVFLHDTGSAYRVILQPWLSKRFSWTLRQTGYVTLTEKIFTTALLAAVPLLYTRFLRRNPTPAVDLLVAQLSAAFLVAGTALLPLSGTRTLAVTGLMVLACGSGFHDALLAFLTSRLDKSDILHVYMGISAVQLISSTVGGALIAFVYGVVLRAEMGRWIWGAPFGLCCLFFVGVVVGIQRLKWGRWT